MCMLELGQLESHWQEFEKRKVRVLVVSVEDQEKAKTTQADFPHLVVVSDSERKLADAVAVIHPRSAPDGGDTAAPTTSFVPFSYVNPLKYSVLFSRGSQN